MATILKINTTQNVNLDFVTASVGTRIVAYLIDYVIKMAYVVIVYYMVGSFGILEKYSIDDKWSLTAILIIFLFPILIYSIVLESLLQGQTIGKRIMKIKVVKIDGFQANFGDYFARWIMRLIDVWTMSGVVGLLSIIISPRNQRLGDMVAGTAVISLRRNTFINQTILMELDQAYTPIYSNVAFLSDRDASIIKNNYDLALKNNDFELIAKLRQKLEEVLKVDASGVPDGRFITDVLRDFNYYTKSH